MERSHSSQEVYVMLSQHDPDHAGSASLLLPAEAEETGHSAPTKKELKVKESQSSARFWLGLIVLLLGLATLATGFIFFSTLPGTLAAEVIGAGVALLIVAGFLVSGTWRPRAQQQPSEAPIAEASPDLPAPPAPATAPIHPETTPPTPALIAELPATASEPISEAPAPILEPSASEAPPASASQLEATTEPEPAPTEEPAAPLPAQSLDKPTTRQRAPAARTSQNGDALPRAKAPSSDTEPRLPALTGLPHDLPPHADRTLIDAQANDLGELLGNVAEQSVLVMLDKGQRGVQRRKRLADKIEAFRNDMARDPDYMQVTHFLEAMIGLLRVGRPIPASRPLVDPFDDLYDYVLKLIRRKGSTEA